MSSHPTLPGRLAGPDLADIDDAWPVVATRRPYESPYMALDVDTIQAPDGVTHQRAIARPHDAIGVLALDDENRVLLQRQYRHTARQRLLEIPAGIVDVAGESALDAAKRELAEEADLRADQWAPLLTVTVTPGYSTERWQLFEARGLHAIAVAERYVREAEEAGIEHWWIDLEAAADMIRGGRITDAQTICAILAARG